VAVALALALALPAAATHTNAGDPNDTPGPFDVRAVRFRHGGVPTWEVATSGRWSVASAWDRGYVVVELDTRGDAEPDHRAIVGSDGRRLVATLYRVGVSGRQRAMGTLRAAKRGGRSLVVAIPLHKLVVGQGRQSYFWWVLSSYTGRLCARTCLDRVPDSGAFEQLLPGVTPSPTPTPSATPTPTPRPSPSPTP
jgi:hypothetical protein